MPIRSQVEICNLALGELPASKVVSMAENSLEANTCKDHYPQVLGELLEHGNWRNARTQAPLAQLGVNDRDPVFAYAYALPGDALIPLRLLPAYDPGNGAAFLQVGQRLAGMATSQDDPGLPYDTAGTTLYASTPGAVLEYVKATPETMSYLFARALILMLAARICMPITKSVERKRQLLAEAKVALDSALASNANSRPQSYGDFIPDAVAAAWGLYE